MSILSFLGRVSKGMIFKIMLVSHMLFLRTLNPMKIRNTADSVRIMRKTIKAVMKSFSSF
jgi:hypothetical protein